MTITSVPAAVVLLTVDTLTLAGCGAEHRAQPDGAPPYATVFTGSSPDPAARPAPIERRRAGYVVVTAGHLATRAVCRPTRDDGAHRRHGGLVMGRIE